MRAAGMRVYFFREISAWGYRLCARVVRDLFRKAVREATVSKLARNGAIGRLALAALAASLVSGCYMNAGLYPVNNSLTQGPSPARSVRISGAFTSGSAAVTLADGEVCRGRWKQSTASSSNPMAAVWDSVYGSGYYVAHVLGERLYAEAVLTGNRGTVLTIQMYRQQPRESEEMTPVRGVGKDNHGTIYKLAS